jgi:hypothetical protein
MLFAAAGFSKLGQQDQKPGCPHASAETKSSNNKIPLLLSLHKKSDPRECVCVCVCVCEMEFFISLPPEAFDAALARNCLCSHHPRSILM